MSLGSIVVRLSMDTATFDTDAGRAAKIADRRAKEIDASFKKAGKAIGLALAGAAVLLTSSIKSSIDSMDELSKSAQKVGVSTEEFSKLTYAAGLADVSMETLVSSLGKLTKSQAASLKSTSEQAKVFDALGISAKNADGSLRESTEVLADFADRFQDLEGSPEAMAAGFALFGRSFQDLIPLLKDGGDGIRAAGDELERFGGVVTTEAGRNAEAFNDNLTRLKTAVTGLALQVASDLLPDLVSLTDNFVELSKDGDTVSETAKNIAESLRAVGSVVEFLTPLFTALVDVVRGLAGATAGTVTALDGLASFNFGRIKAGFQIMNEGRNLALFGRGDQAPAAKPRVNVLFSDAATAPDSMFRRPASSASNAAISAALGDTAKSGGRKKAAGGKSDAQRDADALNDSYLRLIESFKERNALIGAEGEAAKVSYDLQFGGLSQLTQAQKDNVLVAAEKFDADLKAFKAAEKATDLATRRAEEVVRGREVTQDLISDMQFELEVMGLSNAERQKAILLRGLDKDATDEQRAAIAGLSDELERAYETKGLVDDLKASLADAFVDFVSGAKSAKEAFGDFADYLFKRALQIVADKAINSLFEAFGGGGKTGTSKSSGGGFDWGGLIGSLFGGGKASGGMAMPRTMYEVNERGFEMATVGGRDYMMTGSQPVQITPNNKLGGGGVVQNIVLNYRQPYDARTEGQKNQKLASLTSEAMRRNS